MTSAGASEAEAREAREQAKQLRAEVTGGFDLLNAAAAAAQTAVGAGLLVLVLYLLAPLLYEFAYFFFAGLLIILGVVIFLNRR